MIIFFILLGMLLPAVSYGQAIINEIMYDLPGSDTGREWIEVFNQGSEALDLSQWYLWEGGVHHRLTIYRGDNLLAPSGYAVIVDNPEQFLVDWPNFSGVIFDSSFSLSNEGETLVLKKSNKKDDLPIDEVNYNAGQGAKGDGNSLQRTAGGWIAAPPTPGVINSGGDFSDDTTSGASGEEEAEVEKEREKKTAAARVLRAEIISPKLTTVGAPVEFTARAAGGNPKDSYRFFWVSGDGASGFGPSWRHIYEFAGNYVVVLKVVNGDEILVVRKTIEVIEPQISVEAVFDGRRPHFLLTNKTAKEINLGGFQILAAGRSFIFPADTFLAANGRLRLSSAVTGFVPAFPEPPRIVYPNGWLAAVSTSSFSLASADAPTFSSEVLRQVSFGLEQVARRLEAIARPQESVAVPSAAVPAVVLPPVSTAIEPMVVSATSVRPGETVKLNKPRSWFQRLGSWFERDE